MSSIPSPNLDDRTFDQLVVAARRLIESKSEAWTDLSPGDPGIVLLEVFAYLTELMLYRLNRVPDKAYIEFLRLMGVTLSPPAAASVRLRFSRDEADANAITIPRRTLVATAQTATTDAPVFATSVEATIEPGETSVEVLAHHCEIREAEDLGRSTGLPGMTLTVAAPPIVLPTGAGDDLDLRVWVEASPEEVEEPRRGEEFHDFDGRRYRAWREVTSFADLGDDRHVYVADRNLGTITFAPAVRSRTTDDDDETTELEETPRPVAEIPAAGRRIRVSYRRGGGASGNVAKDTLTALRTAIPGVTVTNPSPASGGRDVETLTNALLRGPQELHSPRRAVTADDFEAVAIRSSGAVARARAITRTEVWRHAAPGTVEVVIVPTVEPGHAERPTAPQLREHETDEARERVRAAVTERSPLGVTSVVSWARYKAVRVEASAVIHRSEDRHAVRERLLRQLHLAINPLPSDEYPKGWRFGQPLRVSHVYDILLKDPGVRYAENVKLVVDDVPSREVVAIASDDNQPNTWYAARGDGLFRSSNDGVGWEVSAQFPGEKIERVVPDPAVPGVVAMASLVEGTNRSALRISKDCGETWENWEDLQFHVEDLHWMQRPRGRALLLATDNGLYELTEAGNVEQILVDRDKPAQGFYAVAATEVLGVVVVAAAAQEGGGIYLSSRAGDSGTFLGKGLDGEDVRVLVVEEDGPRRYLWAGAWAAHTEPGHGCWRWEVRGHEDAPEGWIHYDDGWAGSSCRAIATTGKYIFAASYITGVLRLDPRAENPRWEAPKVDCGLPLREVGRFSPVLSVAAAPDGKTILAGGPRGIYRNVAAGEAEYAEGLAWTPQSKSEFTDQVTLPPTWLFCSADHQIDVRGEDAARRD